MSQSTISQQAVRSHTRKPRNVRDRERHPELAARLQTSQSRLRAGAQLKDFYAYVSGRIEPSEDFTGFVTFLRNSQNPAHSPPSVQSRQVDLNDWECQLVRSARAVDDAIDNDDDETALREIARLAQFRDTRLSFVRGNSLESDIVREVFGQMELPPSWARRLDQAVGSGDMPQLRAVVSAMLAFYESGIVDAPAEAALELVLAGTDSLTCPAARSWVDHAEDIVDRLEAEKYALHRSMSSSHLPSSELKARIDELDRELLWLLDTTLFLIEDMLPQDLKKVMASWTRLGNEKLLAKLKKQYKTSLQNLLGLLNDQAARVNALGFLWGGAATGCQRFAEALDAALAVHPKPRKLLDKVRQAVLQELKVDKENGKHLKQLKALPAADEKSIQVLRGEVWRMCSASPAIGQAGSLASPAIEDPRFEELRASLSEIFG